MGKWLKRLMLLIALLLVAIIAFLYGGFRMLKGSPQWYHRPPMSPAQRELLARSAFNKFADIQNAAALARENELAARAVAGVTAVRANSIAVSFSDDELNAFFEKWASYANWKSNYGRYVEDPVVIVEQEHLILAGQVKELDAVLSLQFDPRIDASGGLDVRLERVLAGQLPLPEMFIRPYRDRITASLRANLPGWRERAGIDSDGAANGDLINASMARLFIHVLDHTAADPVLFLPLVERHANVPVRVCGVRVSDHNLTMTVLPLNAKERAALLQRTHDEEPVAGKIAE